MVSRGEDFSRYSVIHFVKYFWADFCWNLFWVVVVDVCQKRKNIFSSAGLIRVPFVFTFAENALIEITNLPASYSSGWGESIKNRIFCVGKPPNLVFLPWWIAVMTNDKCWNLDGPSQVLGDLGWGFPNFSKYKYPVLEWMLLEGIGPLCTDSFGIYFTSLIHSVLSVMHIIFWIAAFAHHFRSHQKSL